MGAVSSACYDHTETNLFAGSMDKTAKLWSLKNSKLLGNITAHIDYVNCVFSFYSSPKGLTGSSDRTFKEWDFNTLKMIKNVKIIILSKKIYFKIIFNFIFYLLHKL